MINNNTRFTGLCQDAKNRVYLIVEIWWILLALCWSFMAVVKHRNGRKTPNIRKTELAVQQ